jgi:hypothetical protein
VRIADGAGISLDGVMVTLSEDFREQIGLEDFTTARAEPLGALARALGPAVRGAAKTFLRIAGWRSRAKSAG